MDIEEFVIEHSRAKCEAFDRTFIEGVIKDRGIEWVALAIECYLEICGED